MKPRLTTALIAILVLGLLAEGLWVAVHFRSVVSAVSRLLPGPPDEPLDGEPAAATVLRRSQFDDLLGAFAADGVGLGNTPYEQLKTERAMINERVDGCLRQKPNVHKTVTQLRTALFEPFDPVFAFWDADAKLSPEVQAFLDRYAYRKMSHTTNELGERITLPQVSAEDVVLVAGDSLAAGTGVDDSETLASQLQAGDRSRRYVNLGVNAAHASDIHCELERAARDHAGHIRRLIYLYCENDFIPGEPYGEPEEVVESVRAWARDNGVGDVTIVYSPYIYNIVPQITRFRGAHGGNFPYHGAEKQRLRQAVTGAGLRWIDFGEIALEATRSSGSQFSVLALFTDHAHYSREGTRRLAERLRGPAPIAGR